MKPLETNELEEINGGTWAQAGHAFLGTLSIAAGVGMGIGSVVLGPGALVAGGALVGAGCSQLGDA